MGIMGRILGAGGAVRQVGSTVGGVAEVFVGNKAEREAAEHQQFIASIGQYGAEFQNVGGGWFDRFMNGLNRLPRPLLTIGTLSLFVYAMVEPNGFALRMEGLGLVPEPLWWLLGAIVSFYFGARELHYQRMRSTLPRATTKVTSSAAVSSGPPAEAEPSAFLGSLGLTKRAASTAETVAPVRAADPHFNAAVEEWRQVRG